VLLCVHGLTRVGNDFDRLAGALADRYRVVCPDVVGRGASDWLRDPRHYGIGQYVADMVTLLARLDAASVDWVGTSMGGLGEYLGKPVYFASEDEAIDYVAAISAPFGLRTREQWREITLPVIRPRPAAEGGGLRLHYDPRIGEPFRMFMAEAAADTAAAGEAALWQLYERIGARVLVTRGAQSDLLSAATAQRMADCGPRAQVVEFAGVGHAPMFMHDEQIAVVRQFLLEE